LAVFHFPASANGEEALEMDINWTNQLANLDKMFYKINMRGTTPTGPALLQTVQFIAGKPFTPDAEDGIMSDYVV
jgi:Ca-activated chloride channel family protein